VKNKFGWTTLHNACWQGRLKIVQYLIETCLVNDTEAKAIDGRTAYDIARDTNNSSVVQYLEKVRSDVTKTTKVTNTQVGKTSSTTNEDTITVEKVSQCKCHAYFAHFSSDNDITWLKYIVYVDIL
jgi:ankyrin repeat protein